MLAFTNTAKGVQTMEASGDLEAPRDSVRYLGCVFYGESGVVTGCTTNERSGASLAACCRRKSDDVLQRFFGLRGAKRHALGHRGAVLVAQMSVGSRHEQAAVLVPQPASNRFEVHTGFDGVAAEEVAQAVVREARQPGFPAASCQRFLRAVYREDEVRL